MSHNFISAEPVETLLIAQMLALQDHPDLEKGLPFPLDDIVATMDALKKAQTRQRELKAAWMSATSMIQDQLAEARSKARANLAVAAALNGRCAYVAKRMGGKPRNRYVRPRNLPPPADPPPADGKTEPTQP